MPTTITALNPTTASAGAPLTLVGSGFAQGIRVEYSTALVSVTDPMPELVNSAELRSVVPDLLQGLAGEVSVKVCNPDEEVSNALLINLLAQPQVETVFRLCSLAALKSALGLMASEDNADARYLTLIEMASSSIAGYCERWFKVESYVEACDGDGTGLLRLAHTPIVSVSALSIDGASVPLTEVRVSPEFIQFDGDGEYSPRLRSAGRVFPDGIQNITVAYTAGYTAVPTEISHACILQVAYLVNTLNKQGLVSEGNTTAGVQTALAQGLLAPAVKSICNRYRRPKVMSV
jgi:hypothetical protein